MKKTNSPCSGGEQPGSPKITDGVNYRSPDGAVEILTKVTTARRDPPHDYPIVCIRVRPGNGTRIQNLAGSAGVEILLSHIEVAEHLRALNAADPKACYTWREIPEKPAWRKAYWDRKNRERYK